jgi:UDP-N-acetylglucosamine--N-acetylmuramyl-(pentapeptide) pyrophosphoryl-undecaprenol N-acetylglucosamine transferase
VTVVFAGGGTGGHLYPAIAIADALRRRGNTVAFVGTAGRLESGIVPRAGYTLYTIAAQPLPRRASGELISSGARNALGIVQSLRLLRRLQPQMVIATGGYVCFPVATAARLLRGFGVVRAPLVLLEPNVSPGLTTRVLAPMVDEIWGECAGFSERARAKCRSTGVPVRYRRAALPQRHEAAARLGLDAASKTLVVIGGSQGARSINDAVLRLAAGSRLPAAWQILLLAGATDCERVRENADVRLSPERGAPRLRIVPYLDDMNDAYALADAVVARAGASTLAELRALALPAVLVPYPHATEGHQDGNARRFAGEGGAVVLDDRDLTAERLCEAILDVAAQSERTVPGSGESLAGDPLAAILERIDALTREENRS